MSSTPSLASAHLKAWRAAQGINQTEAARRCGVSQPTYSDYESGRKTPRTKKALNIQSVTGGAVQVLAWGEPEPTESESDDTGSDAA